MNQTDQGATQGATHPQDLAVCVEGALSSLTSGRAETGGNTGQGWGACSKAHSNLSSSCGCTSVPPVTAELALDKPSRDCSMRETLGQAGQEPDTLGYLLSFCRNANPTHHHTQVLTAGISSPAPKKDGLYPTVSSCTLIIKNHYPLHRKE